MYNPHKWVIIKIEPPDQDVIYKVFATWYGGYTGADEWRLNSGVTEIKEDETHYYFHGASGSIYKCSKNSRAYGTNHYSYGQLNSILELDGVSGIKITRMDRDTDWLKLIH